MGINPYFDHADPLERFMAWETVNSYPRLAQGTTVDPRYRPALGREFPVKVVEVPLSDLHVSDSGLGTASTRSAVFVERKGQTHFRFLVHPESEALYAALIAKHGVAGTCIVTPTASVRTVLVRDHGVFAKLTLDRIQDDLGRAVPDWEVRRAVKITRLVQSIPRDELREHGVALIPEIVGAHVDDSLGPGSYIDAAQGVTFRHGMIYRPTDFLSAFQNRDLYPGFAIFSERDGEPPLLIQWWDEARSRTGVSFEEFVDEKVIAPVVRALAYLVFAQGLIPDSHLQNMIFAINPETRGVETVLLRDLGSVKVNLELRWSRGLSIDVLRAEDAASDFKFEWATEISRRPFYQWFHRYAFSDELGFGLTLRRRVSGYGPMAMARLVDGRVRSALEEHFKASVVSGGRTVRRCLERHLDLHPPRTPEGQDAKAAEDLASFIIDRERLGQTLPLRPGWFGGPNPSRTDYGVVYSAASGPRLALIPA